jgi:hypothetical protein
MLYQVLLAPHLLPSVSIPITAELLAYLLSDDTRLPCPPAGAPPLAPDDPRLPLQLAGAADGDGGASFFSRPLPAAESAVAAALASLGPPGALPRACGAAPVDGGWAASRGGGPGEALRCVCAGEVWALLKASERVRRAVADAASAAAAAPGAAAPLLLTLQRWLPGLQPQRELRCLVAGGALAGVRQRLCGAPPPTAARVALRAALRRLLADAGLAAACEACAVDVCWLGDGEGAGAAGEREGAGGLVLLGAGPAEAFWEGSMDPPGRWEEEGEEGVGGGGGGGGAGRVEFHPHAAHGFPMEVFHFAAERVAAAAGGGLEPGQEAGGLLSELAAGGGEPALGGGWQALVAALHERGAFGGGDSSGSDGEEDDKKSVCA